MPQKLHCSNCGRIHHMPSKEINPRPQCAHCGQSLLELSVRRGEEDSDTLKFQSARQFGIEISSDKNHCSTAQRETTIRFPDTPSDTDPFIRDHIDRQLGSIDWTLSEATSSRHTVEVYRISPTPERPFSILVTSGMSRRPMSVPPGAEEYRYAELMLALPSDWPFTRADLEDAENSWPIGLLESLCLLPHEKGTWLGIGHTVANESPPQPYASNTQFVSALLAPPILVENGFSVLRADHQTIRFLGVVPLFREELEFKLKYGAQALLERFDREEVTELLQLDRCNVCR